MQEEYFFQCPRCWQQISFLVDLSARHQRYIEDCEVCCAPIQVNIEIEGGEIVSFDAEASH